MPASSPQVNNSAVGAIGWRSLRLAQLQDGDALGLTGFGASAHLVLQLARHRFPQSPVYVFARNAGERAFAMQLGAAWAGDTADDAPGPLAAIIDTTPAWKPVVEALPRLMPGGRLVINAIRKTNADRAELERIDYATHLWMEREIKSVANVTRRDVRELLSIAAETGLHPETTRMKLEDVKQGSYIGVAGMPEADGSQKAISVVIFPEVARGLGDGFRPYDLQPNSTMTNAAVSEMVEANDGKTLTVKYKDGEKKIILTSQTQYSTFGPGSRDDLKPGVKVIVSAPKADNGSLESKALIYGRDGVQPM